MGQCRQGSAGPQEKFSRGSARVLVPSIQHAKELQPAHSLCTELLCRLNGHPSALLCNLLFNHLLHWRCPTCLGVPLQKGKQRLFQELLTCHMCGLSSSHWVTSISGWMFQSPNKSQSSPSPGSSVSKAVWQEYPSPHKYFSEINNCKWAGKGDSCSSMLLAVFPQRQEQISSSSGVNKVWHTCANKLHIIAEGLMPAAVSSQLYVCTFGCANGSWLYTQGPFLPAQLPIFPQLEGVSFPRPQTQSFPKRSPVFSGFSTCLGLLLKAILCFTLN